VRLRDGASSGEKKQGWQRTISHRGEEKKKKKRRFTQKRRIERQHRGKDYACAMDTKEDAMKKTIGRRYTHRKRGEPKETPIC